MSLREMRTLFAGRRGDQCIIFRDQGSTDPHGGLTIRLNTDIIDVCGTLRVSYCLVCAHVWEDNPRALASGLSSIHTHSHIITALLHLHAFAHCAL